MYKPNATGAKKWRIVIVVLGVFLVFAAATAVMEFTSRSSFCGTCHEMNTQYTAWAQSSHQNVDCITCHVEPGLINLLQHKVGSLKQVYEHFTDTAPENIKLPEPITQEICLSCHENSPGSYESRLWGKIHNTHTKREIACSSCHRSLVHAASPEAKGTSISVCMNCHR